MKGFKAWLNRVSLGEAGRSGKIALWFFFDSFVASVPYAIMLMAVYMLLGPVVDPSLAIPTRNILILWGVLLAQSIVYYFIARNSYVVSCAGFADVTKESRMKMGEHLRNLPMGFYNRRDAADLSTVLLRDYETVENNSHNLIPQIAAIAARLLLGLLAMAVLNWRMMLASIIVIPLAIPFALYSYRKLTHKNADLLAEGEENTAQIMAFVSGIQTLKAFNQNDEMFHSLKQSCDNLRKKSIAVESANAPVGMIARAIINAGTAVVMGIGCMLLFRGSLAPFTLIAFLFMALYLYNPIINLMMMLVNISRLNYCADRIQAVNDEQPLPFSANCPAPQDSSIQFKDLCFAYGEKPVLKQISFDLPPKSMTALVGPSGSGKSTIIRLIARFWDASSGEIRLGKSPLAQLNADEVLRNVSMVFQDVYLFNDTIENNIRMGRADASTDEVMDAAKRAACHGFISDLPKGYQTMVGEGGSTLSGGEKQRISIARALLKDAPIVLLDEATASLDPENERLIQMAINQLVKDKTVVVIAHRLQSIQDADQILVLGNGSIQERGDHQALMEKKGLYWNLWSEQQKAGRWRMPASKGKLQ